MNTHEAIVGIDDEDEKVIAGESKFEAELAQHTTSATARYAARAMRQMFACYGIPFGFNNRLKVEAKEAFP